MSGRQTLAMIGSLIFCLILGCSPAPTPASNHAPPAPTQAPAAPRAAEGAGPTAAARPTMPMAAATAAPSSALASSGASGVSNVPAPIVDPQRKIIKNAQLTLTVESASTGVDRLTGIAGDLGGYIVSSRTFSENGVNGATVTFSVPVDRFEEALRRVRGIASKVEQETASGQDVTDQYVDLDSQLRNLEATSARIRDFLAKAQNVDEALKVNQQLSQVEKDIETIKGKLNYLGGRSAFSTFTVELREPRPTPTPTATMTSTATPTPTATPTVWDPGQTVSQAVDAQTALAHRLVNLSIWLILVFLPYAAIAAFVVWLVAMLRRRFGRRTLSRTNQPPEP